MNKTDFKKCIQNFATNIGMATAMAALGLTYIPIVMRGEGLLVLLICDIICFCGDVFFAALDWKKIKTMLAELEKTEESAK